MVRRKSVLNWRGDGNVETKPLLEGQVGQQGAILGAKSHNVKLELVQLHQPNVRN